MKETKKIVKMLINEYGKNITLEDVFNKLKDNNIEMSLCSNCKKRICAETNEGELLIKFKCIYSGRRIVKKFKDSQQYHKWHKENWNDVVING